jgi:hypothetical protein
MEHPTSKRERRNSEKNLLLCSFLHVSADYVGVLLHSGAEHVVLVWIRCAVVQRYHVVLLVVVLWYSAAVLQ